MKYLSAFSFTSSHGKKLHNTVLKWEEQVYELNFTV